MAPRNRQLIHVPLALDGTGRRLAPGSVLIEGGRIVRADVPQSIGAVADAEVVKLNDRVLIPGLVNAHAHLDLTHLGPRPFNGSFTGWVAMIREGRAQDEGAIAESVSRGVALSRAGGTAILGDIAGISSLAPIEAMRAAGMTGVSYLEVFGQGRGRALARHVMERAIEVCPHEESGVRLGLQPHAPYSCSPEVYGAAAELAGRYGLPLATHLAETVEELAFVRTGDGPIAEMLKAIGVWDETMTGCGSHPIELLAPILSEAPCVGVHLNYIDEAHIEQLARWPMSVAYCPRASAYFGHGRGAVDGVEHRYQHMLEAGVNVALGTDSIVCLSTADRISVLDEMRLLHQRDGADPLALLRMATVNGAAALRFDPELVTLSEGPTAGLLALRFDPNDNVDPFIQALKSDDSPEWITCTANETADERR